MKTRDEQELAEIMRSTKTDIAKMLVTVQRRNWEEETKLRAEIAALKGELAGRDKVLHLLELMAGEAKLGLMVQR